MPKTKIDGFMMEFPWIKALVHLYIKYPDVRQVYVSRIDGHVLNLTPEKRDIGDLIPWYERDTILLLDHQGEVVSKMCNGIRRQYFFFGKKVPYSFKVSGITRKESIGEMLAKLGDAANDVRYILYYSNGKTALILYKAPKNVGILDWIELQTKSESVHFRNNISDIDAELA